MIRAEVLKALKDDSLLMTMIAEDVGERTIKLLLTDPEFEITWETIGEQSICELIDTPMGRGEVLSNGCKSRKINKKRA